MPAENAGRAFALVLVDELIRHGMSHAVIAPGSRSTPIALALLENPRVTVHVRIDERSASYLALGIAKATGEVVPVLCTSGTAASHFHGAVMEADLSRVPLLVLTADRPPELHGIGANQTVEQAGMYGDAVRWAPIVPVPDAHDGVIDEWRALAAESWARCQGRRGGAPGPVHLNLPLREPLIPVDDGVGFSGDLGLGQDIQWLAPALGPRAPSELIERLGRARAGVIVVGGVYPRSVPDDFPGPTTALSAETAGLLDFATHAGWPVIAEPHSNARRVNAAVLRTSDALLRDSSFTAMHQPDLVLVVGRVGLSRSLINWLETVPHIVLSPDGGNWDVTRTAEAVYAADLEMFADADSPWSPLNVVPADDAWLQAWTRAADAAAAKIDQVLDTASALTEPHVARDVARAVPDGAAFVVASSMPIRDLDLVMVPRSGLTVYANRGVSGIDGFVSTAMGVAVAHDGRTIALCGDLSLLHDVNGLMPGPDPRPDITLVVINNDGGGIFSLLPQANAIESSAFERLFGTPHGMSLEKVAAAYDVHHTLVGTADELAKALSSYGGVRMIEVRTDRAENAALHERLRAIKLGNTS